MKISYCISIPSQMLGPSYRFATKMAYLINFLDAIEYQINQQKFGTWSHNLWQMEDGQVTTFSCEIIRCWKKVYNGSIIVCNKQISNYRYAFKLPPYYFFK